MKFLKSNIAIDCSNHNTRDIQGKYPLKPLIITLTLPLPSKGED